TGRRPCERSTEPAEGHEAFGAREAGIVVAARRVQERPQPPLRGARGEQSLHARGPVTREDVLHPGAAAGADAAGAQDFAIAVLETAAHVADARLHVRLE